MLDLEHYEGREQTYVKHVVLKSYLQKLAYKIGWYYGALYPHMRTVDLKDWLVELKKQGTVRFEGLAPKARKPEVDREHYVTLLKP